VLLAAPLRKLRPIHGGIVSCWAYPGPFNWSPGRLRTARRSCYTFCMSSLLEQVVEDLRSLSREEQDRATEVLQAFLDGLQDDFRLMA
jgi:hypothetical protein